MDKETYLVWGLNGFLKALVYERKYNPDEKCYQDVLRIEEPKAKRND